MDEFHKEKTPIARKEHKCDLCHGTISKGERYVHITQSDSGDIFDYKYHIGCNNLVDRYVRNEGGYVDDFKEYDVIEDILRIYSTEFALIVSIEQDVRYRTQDIAKLLPALTLWKGI